MSGQRPPGIPMNGRFPPPERMEMGHQPMMPRHMNHPRFPGDEPMMGDGPRPQMFPQPMNNPDRRMGYPGPTDNFHPPMPPDRRFERPGFDPGMRTERMFPHMGENQGPAMPLRNPNGGIPPNMNQCKKIVDKSLVNGASNAKKFLIRLKNEILPPRHPSSIVGKLASKGLAIPQNRESKVKQTVDFLKILSHVEVLEKTAKDDILSEEEHEATSKQTKPVNDMQKLLLDDDDDDVEEESHKVNQAQAEDDMSEDSSAHESEANEDGITRYFDNLDEGVNFRSNDKALIIDNDEISAMRIQAARMRKRKHKKIEKYTVDPEWLEKMRNKRAKTGEADGQEVQHTPDPEIKANLDKLELESLIDANSEDIKSSLLIDYLNHICGLCGSLKIKMYVLLIRLIHKTTADNFPDEDSPADIQVSRLEEELIRFILQKDRATFFDVMKFWIHYEHDKKVVQNCPKFDILFPYILNVIVESKLFMRSNSWISFIMTLPAYPWFVFEHVYQVALNTIHRDVAAIKVCSKIVLSGCYKVSIKKECVKILLKAAINSGMTHMKNQAIEALLKAHSAGIFIFGKGDMMRNFFHESLDNLFIKQISEPSRTKSDCQKSLLVLIYRIIADDNKCESADHDTQELIDKCKLFYFDLIFKYYNTFEEETKNWLIKIMFYKIIQIPKFKEGSSKPFMGPPTKEDFKLGLKHPINIEENPMLELVKFGLRNAGQEEHESILQFVDILKSKARLTLDISHEILRASIFNTGYLDVIEKTFETTLKIPNIQKFINKIPNEGTESEKLSILISALLENSKTTGDSRPSPGKRNTHKMITDLLLKAPKSYIKLMKSGGSIPRF